MLITLSLAALVWAQDSGQSQVAATVARAESCYSGVVKSKTPVADQESGVVTHSLIVMEDLQRISGPTPPDSVEFYAFGGPSGPNSHTTSSGAHNAYYVSVGRRAIACLVSEGDVLRPVHAAAGLVVEITGLDADGGPFQRIHSARGSNARSLVPEIAGLAHDEAWARVVDSYHQAAGESLAAEATPTDSASP